jgi:hypothetical protein
MEMTNGIPEPWEQQPQEPPKAFQAFTIYRNMPANERSVRKTAEKLGRYASYMEKWCSKWSWVERARAHDAFVDKETRESAQREREIMVEMHIKAARAMITKALQGLQKIPVDEMTAQDVTKMIDVAAKLERLSRGDATENVETYGREGAPPAVQIYIPSNGREIGATTNEN